LVFHCNHRRPKWIAFAGGRQFGPEEKVGVCFGHFETDDLCPVYKEKLKNKKNFKGQPKLKANAVPSKSPPSVAKPSDGKIILILKI
jgi:hypothetical protein